MMNPSIIIVDVPTVIGKMEDDYKSRLGSKCIVTHVVTYVNPRYIVAIDDISMVDEIFAEVLPKFLKRFDHWVKLGAIINIKEIEVYLIINSCSSNGAEIELNDFYQNPIWVNERLEKLDEMDGGKTHDKFAWPCTKNIERPILPSLVFSSMQNATQIRQLIIQRLAKRLNV